MERVEKTIDIDRAPRVVYDQWTQFAQLPQFVASPSETRQLTDSSVRWRGLLAGRWVEDDIEILEQRPDEFLSWKSRKGAMNSGYAEFVPLEGGQRTQVRVTMSWDDSRVPLSVVEYLLLEGLERFKQFIEGRDEPTGAWRGEIEQGIVQGQPL